MNVTTGFVTGGGKAVEQLEEAHFRLQLRRDKWIYENYFHFRVEAEGHQGAAIVDIYPDQDFLPQSREIMQTHFAPATLWRSPQGPFATDPGAWTWHPAHLVEWHHDFIRVHLYLDPEMTLYLSSHHPLTPERWGDLLSQRAARFPDFCTRRSLGTTPDGQPMVCLAIGRGEKRVAVMAGEHPIESAGSWAVWGTIEYLTSTLPEVRALRDAYRFECAPVVNPDGLARGNACFTSNGTDLFRAYQGAPVQSFPAEEARLVWEWVAGSELALALDFHCYMGGMNQDLPAEALWVVPDAQVEQVFSPGMARRYRLLTDRVVFSTDARSSHYHLGTLEDNTLCYQLAAQRDVPSVMYEFNTAFNGPARNARHGLGVFTAAMRGLTEG